LNRFCITEIYGLIAFTASFPVTNSDRKQNRRKKPTFRRLAKLTRKKIEYSGNTLLFFLQREKDELAPDLLHKEIGEML
jgi:hypothetical protein